MKGLIGLLLLPLLSFSQTVEEVALKAEAKLRSIQSLQANFDQIFYPERDIKREV